MRDKGNPSFRQTISTTGFLLKLAAVSWRIPSMAWHAIRGLKLISGEKNMSWASVLEDIAGRYPDNPAIKSPDGTLTYRELNSRANQFAFFLITREIKKGDTVVLCMENRPELLVALCGCAKAGAVASLINTNQRGPSLAHSFKVNPGRLAFIGTECLEYFKEIRQDIGLPDSQVHFLQDPSGKKYSGPGEVSRILSTMPHTNPPSTSAVTMKDRAAYVYTSGTTGGMPKAAVIIHKRILSAMFWFGRLVTRVRPGHTIYIPLPFFHTNAITVGWPPALYSGAAVAMRRKFSASRFLEDVRDFNVTHFVYVGEVCRYLMARPETPGENKTSLKYIFGNGLRPDIWMAFKKRFGIRKVFEFYGAAEGVGVFTNLFNFDCTVGTSMTPFALVRYDIENDRPLRDEKGFLTRVNKGEAGLLIMEISEKTPFPGYTDKSKTEEKIIRDAFNKGDMWFNTGDMLRNMGFRHAQFVDRLGDTFRWKGENVATMEVEKALDSFPGISASAAYGVVMPGSDGRAGMAALIPAEGARIDYAGLAEHLRSVLPRYAVPVFLRQVKDFEWTATHKIKKGELKKQGFDPSLMQDALHVLLPDSAAYVPVEKEIYREIMEGNHKF